MNLRWKQTELGSYKLQIHVEPSLDGPILSTGEWVDVPVVDKQDKELVGARAVIDKLNTKIT